MTIGIDIDDTITKTAECLLPYVAKYFSLDLDYLIKNNYNYNNLPEECIDRFYEFGLNTFENAIPLVKVKDKAIEVINKLKEDMTVINNARTSKILDRVLEINVPDSIYDELACIVSRDIEVEDDEKRLVK